MTAAQALSAIEAKFAVAKKIEFRGETTLMVESATFWELAKFCRENLGFDYLLDISSVDHFGEEPRFEMVYELYSTERGQHLRLRRRPSPMSGPRPTGTSARCLT